MNTLLIVGILSFLGGGGIVESIHRSRDRPEIAGPIVVETVVSEEALTQPDALVDVCSGEFIADHGDLTCTMRTCLVAGAGPGTKISASCDSVINAASSIAVFRACSDLSPDNVGDCLDWVGRRK